MEQEPTPILSSIPRSDSDIVSIPDESGSLTHRSSLSPSRSIRSLDFLNDESPASKIPNLTFFNSLALVLGLQIGSGIFAAPSQVTLHVQSPGEGVAVWIIAGLLAWTGASCFIELGMTVSRNGGMQEYLQFCYGDFAGLLFTWIWVVVSKPSSNATIATILADYLGYAVFSSPPPLIVNKLIAILAIIIIAAVNCVGVKAGSSVANWFLIFKLVVISSIILIGVFLCPWNGKGIPASHTGWFGESEKNQKPALWDRFGDLVTALLGALFCYGGWESIGFVVGEMKNAHSSLPRVLNGAMMLTIPSFTLVVIVFYLCLPLDVIRTTTTLAMEFGQDIFGISGRIVYSVAISISALGALNANIFATSRLCVVASQRQYFPRIFSNGSRISQSPSTTHPQTGLSKLFFWAVSFVTVFVKVLSAPQRNDEGLNYAILLNTLLAITYVSFGNFNGLIVFVGLSEYLIFFFCVVGVFIMRARRKSAAEPEIYRTRTFNPIVFTLLSGLLVLRGVVANIFQGISMLIVIVVAWVFYRRSFQLS